MCYNHHINSLTSQFRVEKMLPISDLDPEEATTFEQEYILNLQKKKSCLSYCLSMLKV